MLFVLLHFVVVFYSWNETNTATLVNQICKAVFATDRKNHEKRDGFPLRIFRGHSRQQPFVRGENYRGAEFYSPLSGTKKKTISGRSEVFWKFLSRLWNEAANFILVY